MGDLDYDSQQRCEVFARYGLAMYQAQCVEKTLAILVSSVLNKEFLPSEPDAREEMQNEVFAKTTGALLVSVRKQVAVPSNLDRSLEEFRRKRNWLAHNYFWNRAGHVLTRRGREEMIRELSELSDWLSRLDSHLSMICEDWASKVGVTRQAMVEEIRQLTEDAEESM